MKQVHLVCNAHIDPIWQWEWQEGVSVVLSTFRSAVNLAAEFDYIFCHNEVTVYKYVEEYDPALFEDIKRLHREGKWHIMGGWYLQPDCNMPSGESFVRQILEGKRYFMSRFGTFPTTAINFDPFGHTRGLVQIIKKCGQDSYIHCRPWQHECPLPSNQFLWKGFDGSTIKVNRASDGGYGTPLGGAVGGIRAKAAAQPQDTVCVLWGVGNHGGGPSRKDLADIEELIAAGEMEILHSTPEQFFARIHPTEIVDHSLRISMPGCYTSMGRIKRKHIQLENELYMAEKMLTIAMLAGALREYPEDMIHTITEDLLNAEFHDVLPGSSVQSGEDNGLKLLDHGLLEAERLKTRAYFALAAAQPVAAPGEYPVLVFNPSAMEITENVEVEFMLADQNWNGELIHEMSVFDKDGKPVRNQTIKEESNLNLDWRKRIIFEATLPPMSITRFSVYTKVVPKVVIEQGDALVFDNGHKRVEIDRTTGLLKSYALDGVEYVKDAFALCMLDDNPDPWGMSGQQLVRLGTNERAFSLSEQPDGVFRGLKSVSVAEDGEVYLGVEALFELDNTRARIFYKIYKNNDAVDVDVNVFMGDINRMVKLKVPFSTEGTLIGQTAFGTEELYMDARENVSQRFIALRGTDGKCPAILNNCLYGSHFENGALYLSLIRGASYCAHPIHDRPIIPTDRFVKKIDQGENNFSFRLGVYAEGALENAAQLFNQKPYALNVFPTGSPSAHGCEPFPIKSDDAEISIVTMKKADGCDDTYIVRLLNNTPEAKSTEFSLCDAKIALEFVPYEVKTLLLKNGTLTESEALLI
ncbi:MAG: alpha-mannosidase [Clostridia bacterium]|nr:alpha-mannosidase [Clostridia bacterium]